MYGVKLRVHIVPVGYEFDRIILPLKRMTADKVWLISKGGDDDKGQPYKDRIIPTLKKLKIIYDSAECDITDLYDVLRVMRVIIEKEKGNDIFINVSSGSKIEAIAGMMASMIFKNGTRLIPYYAVPKKYLAEPKHSEQQSRGLSDIRILPEYRIEQPHGQLISLLKIIGEHKEKISKKDLIKIAMEKKLIVIGGKKQEQSKYMSLNKNYLDQLRAWRLIDIEKDGRKKNILLTEEGRNMLRFLG